MSRPDPLTYGTCRQCGSRNGFYQTTVSGGTRLVTSATPQSKTWLCRPCATARIDAKNAQDRKESGQSA